MSELESWMNLVRFLAGSCMVSNAHRLGKRLVASSPVFRRRLLQVRSLPPHRRRIVVYCRDGSLHNLWVTCVIAIAERISNLSFAFLSKFP